MYPVLFRHLPAIRYRRERLELDDGDFLDLDWHEGGHERVAILSHGLEGSSRSQYAIGMMHALQSHGWDAVGWNCRSCSGELNRVLRLYHSGSSDDLDRVVQHVLRVRPHAKVALIGYSLGGNITLKYLGERGHDVHPRVLGAVAFSVPCDLASSSVVLAHWSNSVYMYRFMRSLSNKIDAKAVAFPGQVVPFSPLRIRTFKAFDDRYTAPLFGFRNAEDYWARASSRPFMASIRIPTLLMNAADDPFLAPPCYPYGEAQESAWFHLEVPRHGGHCAFVSANLRSPYYSDRRAIEFLSFV